MKIGDEIDIMEGGIYLNDIYMMSHEWDYFNFLNCVCVFDGIFCGRVIFKC